MELREVVRDLADAFEAVDSGRARHKDFQPGIGPFGEAQAVRVALAELQRLKPDAYRSAVVKRIPDLLIPGHWALEFKIVRPFGDNGQPAEHWSENILHPYPGNTSSLGDCLKLLECGLSERKAVVILGFEHLPSQVSIDPAISAFELLASSIVRVNLGPRTEEGRGNLVHPVHQQIRVIAYEVLGYISAERI